ncbi:hypothetical protein [Corynebacterium riegelii]|uniref:hypothetical protein n=1 Tax=Corynebacterium riegelii TaxID=156976 RepID=UPI0012ED3457|nr:hypothetical protein [Corynebacterium riegelii]
MSSANGRLSQRRSSTATRPNAVAALTLSRHTEPGTETFARASSVHHIQPMT